jgi:transposase-like protein
MTKRRNFSDQFKAAVALEALRGDKTVQEIVAKRQLHPTQVSTWKRQAIEGIHLEKSVRNSKLPRVVDKEKFDLKSVMLNYLSFTSSSALVFTSEKAVASTKQSHLKVGKSLLDSKRIQRVKRVEDEGRFRAREPTLLDRTQRQ